MKKIVASMAMALVAGMTFATPAEAEVSSKNPRVSAWVQSVEKKPNGNVVAKVVIHNETNREKGFKRAEHRVSWDSKGIYAIGASNKFYVAPQSSKVIRFKARPNQVVSFSVKFKKETILSHSGLTGGSC